MLETTLTDLYYDLCCSIALCIMYMYIHFFREIRHAS